MNLQLVSGFLFACQPIGLLNYSVGPVMLKRAEEKNADHCRWFIQIGTMRHLTKDCWRYAMSGRERERDREKFLSFRDEFYLFIRQLNPKTFCSSIPSFSFPKRRRHRLPSKVKAIGLTSMRKDFPPLITVFRKCLPTEWWHAIGPVTGAHTRIGMGRTIWWSAT